MGAISFSVCRTSRKGSKMEFKIRRAGNEDISGMMRVMEEARENPGHPDWFVADDEEYIQDHLDGKGFAVVAEAGNGDIAGFFVVKYPEQDNNLGTFLGYSAEQLGQTVIMDSAAVAEIYRGHGLQGKMLDAAEERIDDNRWRYLLCTVHPDNIYSLSNMESHGYVKRAEVTCYGGRRRYVLEKMI